MLSQVWLFLLLTSAALPLWSSFHTSEGVVTELVGLLVGQLEWRLVKALKISIQLKFAVVFMIEI